MINSLREKKRIRTKRRKKKQTLFHCMIHMKGGGEKVEVYTTNICKLSKKS